MTRTRISQRCFAVVRPDGMIVTHTIRPFAGDAREAALRVLTGADSGEKWRDIYRRGNRVRRVRVTVER